jgi:hypothetical protein
MEKNIIYYLNILLVSIFAIIFINIIFFTYGKNIEQNVIVSNVDYIANNINSTIKELPPQYIKLVKNIVNNNNNNNNINDTNNNDNLLYNSIKILVLLVSITAITFIISYKYYDLSYDEIKSIFINSFVLVLGMGLVEILFLTFVIKNFMLADMNKIKLHVLQKI